MSFVGWTCICWWIGVHAASQRIYFTIYCYYERIDVQVKFVSSSSVSVFSTMPSLRPSNNNRSNGIHLSLYMGFITAGRLMRSSSRMHTPSLFIHFSDFPLSSGFDSFVTCLCTAFAMRLHEISVVWLLF